MQPSIFEGLGEEMSISSASLLKPRKRLILKNKDNAAPPTSSLYVGDEEPPSNTQTAPLIIDKEIASSFKPPSTKQLEFSTNLDISTGT